MEKAVPPAPISTTALGIATVEIRLNSATGALDTRVLHGEGPAVTSALDALRQWRFKVLPGTETARTSVTFVFRPPVLYSLKPVATAVRPWMPAENSPALPQMVTDPGYPIGSSAVGAVIFAAAIDADGVVTVVEAIPGIPTLTERAESALRNWKFSPAIISGKREPSVVFVVISFALPT
jgi:hypothetical protein